MSFLDCTLTKIMFLVELSYQMAKLKRYFVRKPLFNPNRPLDCSAQTYFGINPTISRHGIAQARLALLIWLNEMVLFVIFLSAFPLQWNPIAPSNRKEICSKIQDVIIITLMTDLG